MSSGPQALLSCPDGVRAYTHDRQPGFADAAPSGRLRLDAIARWLQDVAWADVEDAGLQSVAVWVVRRTRIRVTRFPRFGEHFSVTTFCSGLGRMWAERRTDIVRAGETAPDVEAVSVWVHLDPVRWVPTPLTEAEITTYTGPGPARRVTARLRHPAPGAGAGRSGGATWPFRAVDRDIAGHVNNAAYWEPLEEELLSGEEPARIDVELEYRTPAQAGPKRVLRDGDRRWIVDAADPTEVHASLVLVRS